MDSFSAAITRKQDYSEAHFMMGTILRQQKKLEEAIHELRQAIHYQPNSAEAYLSLAQSLRERADTTGADAALAEAERINKKKADAQAAQFALSVGQERLRKNDLQGAIEKFRQAIRLAPELARAHLQLALALEKLGDTQDARKHFEEARRLAPYLDRSHLKD
jgi:tetratricopeptide (TPR) repeat protein